MKKTIKLLVIMLMAIILIFSVKNNSYAEGSELTISMGIKAPNEGIYGVGQEVEIKLTFSKPIKGELPKYTIEIGDESNKKELETDEITEYSTEAIYKYTIKSGDNGKIEPGEFVDTSNYKIEDEDGNQYYLSTPFMMNFDKEIYASTTIKWADFSEAKIEMVPESDKSNDDFDITVSDAIFNIENNQYYVHFSHTAEENIVLKNEEDVYNNAFSKGEQIWQTTYNSFSKKININDDVRNFVAEKGDIYITICEIDNKTSIPNIVLKSKKIERMKSLPISKRFSAFFFDDETSTFCWEPHGDIERKINYKIGKVSDKNLLMSLKNGDTSALTNLMEYAKSQNPLYTGILNLGVDKTITDKMDLVDDEYYYVYLQLDSENGKYIEIEDVNLYQAVISDVVGKNLFDMDDSQFKWNLDEETNKIDTTIKDGKLPAAGKISIFTVFMIVSSCIILVLYKKCKKYKDI